MLLNTAQMESSLHMWLHSGTDLATVDLQIRRLHKMAEKVSVGLQMGRGEQPEILHHAVRGRRLVEEMEEPLLLALLHNINHLQHSRRQLRLHVTHIV